jgi:hypothetical protein
MAFATLKVVTDEKYIIARIRIPAIIAIIIPRKMTTGIIVPFAHYE